MLHVRACARKSRLIFNPRSSEKSSLRVRQSLAYRGDSSLITKKNKIKSAPRVTFRTLILSLPFNNFAATHSLCTLIYILSTFLFQPPPLPSHSPFLSLTLFSLFPVCTLAVCLTDPLDLTWHKQQSLCKKGTIFVKRNSLARDTLILFSAKHTDLYRVESIDENIKFGVRPSIFHLSVEWFWSICWNSTNGVLSKPKLYRALVEKFGCVISRNLKFLSLRREGNNYHRSLQFHSSSHDLTRTNM